MKTTVIWRIANLERKTADGVVMTAHYTIDASDGTYSAGAYGSMELEHLDEGEMIPFGKLTEEICIGWVKKKLTEEKVKEIEIALQTQLDEQHAPSKATGVPWFN
jgi:hypothetical protein